MLHWNGKDVPAELRALPPGDYVLEPCDPALSPDEESGIREGLAEIERGESVPWEQVQVEIDELLRRR